jgi:hypothetical protein
VTRGASLVIVVLALACGNRKPKDPKVDKPAPTDVRGDDPVDPVDDYVEADEPAELGAEGDDTLDDFGSATGDRAVLDRALETFSTMRSSTYVHRSSIDATRGHFDFDCSGFVDYVLAESNQRAFAELRAATVKRPLARHFVQFFQSLGARGTANWLPVARPADLAPGDVLAWLKPADVTSRNTGHVMIVREAPRFDAKHDLWTVPIIDSTAVPHGKGDSRKTAHATGLGTGEVLLVVDGAGAPIGYRWSRGKKAKLHHTTIAFARVRG